MASVAKLEVELDATKATLQAKGFGTALDNMADRGKNAMGKLRASVIGLSGAFALGFIGNKILHETIEAQNRLAQLEAVIISTGGAAGVTSRKLQGMATAMQGLTTFSDEAVISVQTLLLSFSKINSTNIERATQSVLNLAQRMGGDAASAAMQLGKALEDPERGLMILRRTGIYFSQEQIDLVQRLYDTGQVARGQGIIFAELEKKFGGAANAARGTLGGALTGLKNALGDIFEASTQATGGIVGFINALERGVSSIKDWSAEIKLLAFVMGAAVLVKAVRLAWAALANYAFMSGLTAALAIIKMEALTGAAALRVLAYTWLGFSATAVKAFAAIAAPIAVLAAGYYTIVKLTDATNELLDAEDNYSQLTMEANVRRIRAQDSAGKRLRDRLEQERKAKEAAEARAAAEKEAWDAFVAQKKEEEAQQAREARWEAMERARDEARHRRLLRELQTRLKIRDARTSEVASYSTQVRAGGEFIPGPVPGTGTRTPEIVYQNAIQRDLARMTDAYRKKDLEKRKQHAQQAAEEELRIMEQFQRNMIESTQSATGDFFSSLLSDGLGSFRTLWQSFRDLAIRAIAQILASNMMAKLSGGLGSLLGVSFDKTSGLTSITGRAAPWLGGLGAIGSGIAAGATGGPLGGALGGAAAGASIGSVIPGLGTAVGAVLGAVAGFVSGLFGQSKAARQAAEQFRQAVKQWELSLEEFADMSVDKTRTSFQRQIADLDKQSDALAKAAHELHRKANNRTKEQIALDDKLLGGRNKLSGDLEGDIAKLEAAMRKGKISDGLQEYLDKLYELRDAYRENVKAIEAEMARVDKQRQEDLIGQLMTLANDPGAARYIKELEQQRIIQGLVADSASEATIALQRQVFAAQETAEKIAALSTTLDTLKSFRDSLLVGGSSPLSPMAQAAELRRRYNETLTKAQAGDQAAAQRLPEVAQQLLEIERALFASGPRYAATFEQVSRDVDAVIKMYDTRLSTEQETLKVQTALYEVWKGDLPVLKDTLTQSREEHRMANEKLEATVNVLQEGFTQAVTLLADLGIKIDENTRATRLGLEAVAAT